MRCTTCGTENAPDSRFCGGCGARQPASGEQRLAPTAKISDDAPFPSQSQAPTNVVRPPTGPVSYAPPSIPPPAVSRPQASIPASSPPTNPPTSQQRHVSGAQKPVSSPPRAAPAPVAAPSMSFSPPPQRSMALIVIVLLFDLGLAVAGGVLLMKGLEDRAPAKTEPAPEPTQKQSAIEAPPAPAPAAAAAVAPAPAPVAEPIASAAATGAPNAAAREAPKDTKRDKPKAFVEDKPSAKPDDPKTKAKTKPDDPKAKTKPDDSKTKPDDPKTEAKPDGAKTKPDEPARVTSVPAEPQDPYPSTDKEIDAAAAKSKSAFARCASNAGSVQGTIKIAFQVRSDGHVINAAAVENTTGDGELARCLVTELSSWRVSAHHGAAINLLRSFNYP